MKTDEIITSLKKRYFDLLAKENYPHTPKLTQEADNIEQAIAELQQQAQSN